MNLWQLLKWSFYIDLYAVPALLICFLLIEPGVFPWLYRISKRLQRRQILRLDDRRRLRLLASNQSNRAAQLPPEIQLIVFEKLQVSLIYPPLAETVVQHWGRILYRAKQNALPRYSQDLRSCALTCRAWSECANKLLGQHLALRSHRDVEHWRASATSTATRHQLAGVRRLDLPNCHYECIPLVQQMWREAERRFGGLQGMTTKRGWLPDPWRARHLSQAISVETTQLLLRACINLHELTVWAYDSEPFRHSLFALDEAAPPTLSELKIRIPDELRHSTTSPLAALGELSHGRETWVGNLQKLALDGVTCQADPFEAYEWTNLREFALRNSHITLRWLQVVLRKMPILTHINFVNVKIFDAGQHWAPIDYSALFAPVVDTLEELTLMSVMCMTSIGSSPIWTTGLPRLRSVTVDATFLWISRTQTEAISPPWVESLTFVMRPRPRTKHGALVNEVKTLIGPFAVAACQAAPHTLRRIQVWDYLASDTVDNSISAAEILKRMVRRHSPEVHVEHYFVKLPFTERELLEIGKLSTSQSLRKTIKSQQPVARWLERTGLVATEDAPFALV